MSESGPVVFRVSRLGVLAAVMLAVCVTPVAAAGPGLVLFYLLPLGALVWVLRARTTVDAEVIVARGALRTRRVAWADVTAMRVRSSRTRSGISAVLRGGAEVALPAVRTRDLPLLAAASGGRLPDPTAEVAVTSARSTTEPGATEPPAPAPVEE